VPAVSPEHRIVYDQAQELLRQGKPSDARTTAQPLFSIYPDDYAVQDLRCKLAMARTQAWAATQRECEPLMRLARPTPPGVRPE
jgi:predicted Zn-dependent protease